MFCHTIQLRVRYGETDQMGVVYYGNYALYYEVGRVEAIRSLGFTYKSLEEKGVLMPVVRMECKYLKPARYDDLLIIETCLRELPGRLIEFHVSIYNDTDVLLNKGIVQLAFYDITSKKTIPTPEFIRKKLEPYFED